MADKDNLLLKVVHYGGVLIVVCLVASVSLGFIYKAARPEIDRNEERRKKQGLEELFPEEGIEFNEISVEKNGDSITYTEARKGKDLVGYAIEGAAKGYSSTIKVLVRTDPAVSRIERIQVISSKETPGLGERIKEVKSSNTLITMMLGKAKDESGLKPWFQERFNGLSKDDVRIVKKDSDKGVVAISGATVSSAGVVKAVKNGIQGLNEAVRKKK